MRNHFSLRPQKKIGKIFAKGELRKGLLFITGILFFYAVFSLILTGLNLYALDAFAANAASSLLSFAGVPNQVLATNPPAIAVENALAQISDVCSGGFEIALLFAIVLATWDRTWRQKAWGCFFGLLLILAVNPIRIAIVLATGVKAGWATANLTHDVAFRASLLITTLAFYYAWYVKYDAALFKKIRKMLKKTKKATT